MEILTHDELVEKLDRFLDRHNMAVTRLGRAANGDPNLVANIRAGRSPSLETLNRLARVMAEHDALNTDAAPEPSGGNAEDLTAPIDIASGVAA